MRYLKNQNGIALVTALLLTLITLAVIMAVFYLLNQHTKTSAAEKVYSSALQAAYGDSELFIKDLIPSLFPADHDNNYWENMFSAISLDIVSTDACINDKLQHSTDKWTKCPTGSTTQRPDFLPDATIILNGTTQNYKVYSKIVDTFAGNTDGSGLTGERYTSGDGATGNGSGTTPVKRIPYLYTVEIQAEGSVNPKEKAQLEVLYAY